MNRTQQRALQRRVLGQINRLKPADRHDERDHISLLLPWGVEVDDQIVRLATSLGATVVLKSSHPEVPSNSHQHNLRHHGHNPDDASIHIERYVSTEDDEHQRQVAEMAAEMELIAAAAEAQRQG